ncbi:cytochrome c-type biogenesis protein [Idiomarina piscisalsi]|uniref:Cytochrome c-type biogenesis protein n=1 Tax=Idiomarina piscisalsi TaxID=1096243 RepID=A0A432YN01_9GAMM|nr:cytochrome c-type biogenesis protein [Idiomarina piscisalsi]RUO62320.1 cystathionine gamma-synthase [Idiomarina piscisalsi]
MSRLLPMLFLLSAFAFSVVAQDATQRSFDNEQQREVYQQLIKELRCPKCQNQNIADSNAPLAEDMRDKSYEMLKAGKSKQEIIDFMVERYGNFVHYKPPFTAATAVLWFGPVVILIIGIGVAVLLTRKKKEQTALTPEERAQLEQLRKNDND